MDRDDVVREIGRSLAKRSFPHGDGFESFWLSTKDEWIAHAENALARAEELGWKLMPREPSEAMHEAGMGYFDKITGEECEPLSDAYQAMWDAAGEKR